MKFIGESHHRQPCIHRKTHLNNMSMLLQKVMKSLHLSADDTSLLGAGISGALLVPALADRRGLSFALIRERGCRPTVTSKHRVIGVIRKNVIFIDDCIDSGNTLRRANIIVKETHCRAFIVAAVVDYTCNDGRRERLQRSFNLKIFSR